MNRQIHDWRSALKPEEEADVAAADVLALHHGKLYHDAVAKREAIRKRASRRLRHAARLKAERDGWLP